MSWRNFGQQGRPNFGFGVSLSPQEIPLDEESVVYESFAGGLDMSDAPENVARDKAVLCLDMEVTRSNRLVRAPGVLTISQEAHDLFWLLQQASLDYTVELVAIDPPFLGYKGSGGFNWVDLSLAATGLYGWNGVAYAGDLLFSNGVDATYWRAPGAAVVTDISADVIARTFTQQFGRLFAGFYTDAGDTQALGIKWNDTTGAIDGWAGTGSGNELLLPTDGTLADHVVALRGLGYDILAVLNRNSLWAGYPTGKDNRPADFRFRFGGVGCVHERTARVVPGGVAFLSDEGVVLYNANSAPIISGEINSELLPLDYYNLIQYCGAYSQVRRRYYLQAPTALYIYEFPIPELKIPGRWFKRSVVVDTLLGFSSQVAATSWDSLVGTWDAQSQAWDTFGMPGWASPSDIYFALDGNFGQEDPSLMTWFGQSLTPMWRTPQAIKERTTDNTTTVGWEIVYSSQQDASINLKTSDTNGDFNNSVTKTLPNTLGVIRRKLIWSTQTGQGIASQIEFNSGYAQILRLRQILQKAGPAQGSID